MNARKWFTAFLSGSILAVALALGRLTRPEVIVGWVDFSRGWDPTMLVFFIPAVLVYHCAVRWARSRANASVGPKLCEPPPRSIDVRLLIGSCIFGMGWAIGGACPGPALTSLGAGAPWTITFVAAMVAGLFLGRSIYAAAH